MNINNMIRNRIDAWLEELDMEEIIDNAIDMVLEEYIGDISDKVQEKVAEELRNGYCYETEIDKAIDEIIRDNMN